MPGTVAGSPVSGELAPAPAPDDGGEHPISVVGRITLLIDAFDETHSVLSLGELTERTGLPKSTVHRLADQLLALRWLDRTPVGYRIGLRFFEVGGLVAARNNLRDRAHPYLADLQAATGHPVHLAILEGHEVVVLEKVWGHGAAPLPTRIGGRLPAHSTALGKALLAFPGPGDVDRVLAAGLDRRTPRTVVLPDVLVQQLKTARTTQWAMDDEEHAVGVRCVAAPIRGSGRAIGAVCVSGPAHSLEVSRAVPHLRRCAAEIWTRLFGRRRPDHGPGVAGDEAPWDLEQWRRWLDGVAGEWM
jgi:DNA-binding IclR family transcriptional regulator